MHINNDTSHYTKAIHNTHAVVCICAAFHIFAVARCAVQVNPWTRSYNWKRFHNSLWKACEPSSAATSRNGFASFCSETGTKKVHHRHAPGIFVWYAIRLFWQIVVPNFQTYFKYDFWYPSRQLHLIRVYLMLNLIPMNTIWRKHFGWSLAWYATWLYILISLA